MKDGVYLNHQTSAFLFEVDGKQVFTVISNNGVQSVQLTGTGKSVSTSARRRGEE